MSAEVKTIEENATKDDKYKEKDIKEVEEERIKERDDAELKVITGKSLKKRLWEWLPLAFKIVQLLRTCVSFDRQCLIFPLLQILCATCFALFFEPVRQNSQIVEHHLEQVALILGAFVGYMIINTILIASRCMKDTIPFRVSVLFAIIASLLFFVSGILLSVNRRDKFQSTYFEPDVYLGRMLTAATVLSFLNAIMFAADASLTFVRKINV